jgi:aminoglycoside phosphotransferase (APT) family kinase protein
VGLTSPMGGPRVLDQSEVVRYLIDRSLLAPHAVVDGTVVVRDASSRNRIFIVDGGDTSSFVLKQGTSPEGVAAVAHEAAVYESLGQRRDRISNYLPTMWEYDKAGQVLILGKVHGDRDLRAHQVRIGRFSRALAISLGDALGALHQKTAQNVPETLQCPTPWVLSVHQPNLSIFRNASSAALELIRIVQSAPEFGDRLEDLRGGWEPSCLIHHDVKWDNLIACPTGSRRGAPFRLRIIDWEAAQLGDPRWDIGSVFSQYLSLWLFSIPITGRDPPERFPDLAKFPLGRMQPAMANCWSAYRKRADLDRPGETAWLLAAVSYAGARLVQTAFEAAQVATHLDSSMVLHLQLASNILGRPREAAAHLLGITMGPGR